MIDRSKVKFGEPLLGYRFKPGDCIVNSDLANEFTQGICTQKELDDLKTVTQKESYGLLYYSMPVGMPLHGIRLDANQRSVPLKIRGDFREPYGGSRYVSLLHFRRHRFEPIRR
jgi:hypothetical protein